MLKARQVSHMGSNLNAYENIEGAVGEKSLENLYRVTRALLRRIMRGLTANNTRLQSSKYRPYSSP